MSDIKGIYELVINKVTAVTGITEKEILSKSQLGHIMEARHAARYLCFINGLSKALVAVKFDCTHATIISCVNRMENRIATERKFREKISSDYADYIKGSMRKPIYIIGKVTGEPYKKCFNKFEQREKQLHDAGFIAINPMKLVPPETPWAEAMRICIAALVQSYAVSPINGWQRSEGANLEMNIAKKLEFPIMP